MLPLWLRAQMAVGLKQLSEVVDGYLIQLILAKMNLGSIDRHSPFLTDNTPPRN